MKVDQDTILATLKSERLRLCDMLDELKPAEWEVASLCEGWTAKDVVAHLTIPTRATTLGVVVGAIRALGNFHAMAARQARERAAAFTPKELIAQLRETAGSPRRMPGSGPMDPLVDVVVHGQDIVRPLGRELQIPAPLAVAALGYVAGSSFTGAPKRLVGKHLVATDVAWTHGQGPHEVRGPVAELLMFVLGRPADVEG